MTVFLIAAFYGMTSEGFARLWTKHFYDHLGFPAAFDLEPIVWFGVLRVVSAIISLAGLELIARRRLDLNSHHVVSRGLFVVNGLQVLSVAAFALAGDFTTGAIAFWVAVVSARVYDPLYLAWLNQNIDSEVRATVISMSGQVDSFGQIAGGPPLGLLGTLTTLRASFLGAAALLVPALFLYLRAFGQGARSEDTAPQPADAT
jgi:hypothetical protein